MRTNFLHPPSPQIGYAVDFQTLFMALSNVSNIALADEFQVIDAIYGQGTITITSTNPHHTSVELRLLGDLHAFLLTFPADYPEQAPSVIGIDSLLLSLQPVVNEAIAYLRVSIFLAYNPGEVCLFDVIEKYRELRETRRRLCRITVAERNHAVVVKFDEQMKALAKQIRARLHCSNYTRPFSLEQTNIVAAQIIECAVCLDPTFKHYAANLSCKHSFCIECLQEGLGSMMTGNGEFKCCGRFIPASLVQQFGNLNMDDLRAYDRWHSEATSRQPLYCCQKTCSTFIPSYLFRKGLAKCMECGTSTCVACRGKQHVGVCGDELKNMKKMAKLKHWQFCPTCSHLVDRTEGCSHMTCVCGTRFCYHCGKAQKDCLC